jgi:hypothetical protein
MPDREELLQELTFKGQCENNCRRVYYTLTTSPDDYSKATKDQMTQHRVANVLSGLIEKLVAKNVLTESELDQILLACRG